MIIEGKDLKPNTLPLNSIIHGDALSVLKKLPSNSIDCVITSPPYWSKRDYGEETIVEWSDGTKYQLGLEPTPELYVEHLIEIFREVKRVLKPHGNLFVVIDDTYCQRCKGIGSIDPKYPNGRNTTDKILPVRSKSLNIPQKSLCLVPELFAIRMVYEEGWILRNKIIWSKKVHLYKDRTTIGNAMPHSVKDRLNHTWEYVFHFVKKPKYWYDLDAVRVPHKESSIKRDSIGYKTSPMKGRYQVPWEKRNGTNDQSFLHPLGANPGDVVQINIEPLKYHHYASFPTRLVEMLIKVGCPKYVCKICGKPRELIYERIIKHGQPKQASGKYANTNGFIHSAGARDKYYTTVRRFKIPKSMQVAFAKWLKQYVKSHERELDEVFGEHKWRHWIRTDESGACLPELDDYRKLKQILNLPNTWDKWLLETVITLVDDKGNSWRPYSWSEYCRCGSTSWDSGIVLDPFLGSGTTALVAIQMKRKFIGIELSTEYCKIAQKRILEQILR